MYTCPNCRLGRVKEAQVPFVYMLDKTPLIVPKMPAYVCDVCGELEYDNDMMMNVQYLIHQHSSNRRHQMEIKQQVATDNPQLVSGV